ncbi:hypothetical protein [Roseateles amylovorans]|uniref:Uncharacterized protein n=1 Tax=Roseateles amylovorans TaxID=2978473 RepID=A0ABY6AYL3_9BURK|nr:hypothetical protein [Roseateles amylovorans]UXH76175.1 hypothetical protein N4261_13940 [Roseateles amylovorans]
MATGNFAQFSWKAVGQSALSAGITAGVGSALSAAASSGGILNGTGVGSLIETGKAGSAMLKAGMGSAVSLAVQGQWNWREVGASTVAGGAGYYAGRAVGDAMQGFGATAARIAESASAAVAGTWASSQMLDYNSFRQPTLDEAKRLPGKELLTESMSAKEGRSRVFGPDSDGTR